MYNKTMSGLAGDHKYVEEEFYEKYDAPMFRNQFLHC